MNIYKVQINSVIQLASRDATDPHYDISLLWGSYPWLGPYPYPLPPHKTPAFTHSSTAPFFLLARNLSLHSFPSDTPLLSQSTFSHSRSTPNTLTIIHPLNQSTITFPFHMTKPFKYTLVYSPIFTILNTTSLIYLFNRFFSHPTHP